MRSLHNTKDSLGSDAHRFFTQDVLTHIEREGFVYKPSVFSYASDSIEEKEEYSSWAFVYNKYETSSGWPITIYIRNYGLEIDVDYDCGGNSSIYCFPFHRYDSFEEAYDELVIKVAELRQR